MSLDKKKYFYRLKLSYRRLKKVLRRKKTKLLAEQISLIFILIVAVVVVPIFLKSNFQLSPANYLGDKAKQILEYINNRMSPGPADTSIQTDVPVTRQTKPENKFSRITFFFKAPFMGSLAIPETWEGKYQTEETATSVDFWYAPPKQSPKPLFTIHLFKATDSSVKNLEVIKKIDNQVFALNISSEKVDGINNVKEYEAMKNEIRSIISSFKTHKQQP